MTQEKDLVRLPGIPREEKVDPGKNIKYDPIFVKQVITRRKPYTCLGLRVHDRMDKMTPL